MCLLCNSSEFNKKHMFLIKEVEMLYRSKMWGPSCKCRLYIQARILIRDEYWMKKNDLVFEQKCLKRDKRCIQLIHEVTKMWTRVCHDIMLLPKVYINRLYFRAMFEKRLREHFGYNRKILIQYTPIMEVVTFIRSIREQQYDYNISALADALDGTFSKIHTDVMMKHWYPFS